jgi:membrane associated rhomboid family serine protease
MGGRFVSGRPGLVTEILIGMCVLGYALEGFPGLAGGTLSNHFYQNYVLSGFAIAGDNQYYRLLTAAFLHASVLHILFNMYALYLLGTQLEQILGRARFIALFVLCAIGGNTLSYVMSGKDTLSLGASTAIFGFFAARSRAVSTSIPSDGTWLRPGCTPTA